MRYLSNNTVLVKSPPQGQAATKGGRKVIADFTAGEHVLSGLLFHR
jgi:hypothetical protein